MKTVKSNIFNQKALEQIKYSICSKKILLSIENQIIFLFGAQSKDNNITAREHIYRYSQKHWTNYQFLIAEDFFKTFSDNSMDLLTIEGELATYTDCVLILLESPGAIAELGAFALHNELVKKILAVNKIEHKHSTSFISLGPLAKVKRVSKFGDVIYANFNSILTSVNEIEKRLINNLRKKSKSINLTNVKEFLSEDNKRFKLLLISDLITLFGPITEMELINILKFIYETDSVIKINFDLSLLKSIGFLKQNGNFYYKAFNKEFYFYKYMFDIYKIRYQVFNHYAKHYNDRLIIPKL